jgi:hypothetical protein
LYENNIKILGKNKDMTNKIDIEKDVIDKENLLKIQKLEDKLYNIETEIEQYKKKVSHDLEWIGGIIMMGGAFGNSYTIGLIGIVIAIYAITAK